MMSPEKEGSMVKNSTSPKPQQATVVAQINCPRCDSPNTKFCYYNNYSLSQPRHFCKTCRRYWTKGGSLRNVPIGGGCRKNKKMKSSSSPSSSRVSADHHLSIDSIASSDRIGGLNDLPRCLTRHGFSALWPLKVPRLQSPNTNAGLFGNNHFSNFSLGNSSNNFMGLSSFPLSTAPGFQKMGASGFSSSPSIASSIESLTSINQELHWKLQQQRLAMLCVGENEKENDASSTHKLSGNFETLVQKPQTILFHNLETDQTCGVHDIPRKDSGAGETLSTEWFFDNSLVSVNPTPETISSNVIDNENPSNWNIEIQAWNDLTTHFTPHP